MIHSYDFKKDIHIIEGGKRTQKVGRCITSIKHYFSRVKYNNWFDGCDGCRLSYYLITNTLERFNQS